MSYIVDHNHFELALHVRDGELLVHPIISRQK
jgi:hypothetical protein